MVTRRDTTPGRNFSELRQSCMLTCEQVVLTQQKGVVSTLRHVL